MTWDWTKPAPPLIQLEVGCVYTFSEYGHDVANYRRAERIHYTDYFLVLSVIETPNITESSHTYALISLGGLWIRNFGSNHTNLLKKIK